MVSLSTAAVTIQPASTMTDTGPRTTNELNWKSSVLSDTEDKFATFSGSHSSYLSSRVPQGLTPRRTTGWHTAEEVMELWPGRSRSDSGPTKPTNHQPKSCMPISHHQVSHFCTCKTSPCHDMDTTEVQTNWFIILAGQLHSVILPYNGSMSFWNFGWTEFESRAVQLGWMKAFATCDDIAVAKGLWLEGGGGCTV